MRAVAIVLHDVSPATWSECKRLVEMVDELAPATPITHLLVPDFHHRGALADAVELRRWIDVRLARGDELALHGLCHLDEAAAPRTPAAWLARRVLTAGEAEFSTLSARQAQHCLEQGWTALARCGWQATGFVPPAWQISAAARSVLTEFPFRYTSSTQTLSRLPSETTYRVPGLVFSARSKLRRWVSIRYNHFRLAAWRAEPLLRIGLHPVDGAHAATLNAWRSIIRQALSDRTAVTKDALLCQAELQAELSGQPIVSP